MGRVYRAEHMQLDSEVAVKVLNPDLVTDGQTIRRFHHEARAASRLHHPNAIRIHDFGEAENGLLYLVMELLRGRTLGEINRREGPLPPARIARLLGQALLALDEAHHAGVIHRDFKPENIFVEDLRSGEEHVKVLDFGIAKARGLADSGITSAGSVCGTPDYMSPEQIRGEDLDARSDVYAAGVVLYELLTGTRPYEGSLLEVLARHLSQAPEAPRHRRPDLRIAAGLELICLRAMNKRRDDRYPSSTEMERALQAAVEGLSGQTCPTCGEAGKAGIRFCPWCGSTMGGAVSKLTEGQRSGVDLPRWPERFLGRDDALRRLSGLDQKALVIVGPSGIGKTRLLAQWMARLGGARPLILTHPDPSGARTPLRPIRAALAQALGISERPGLAELDLSLEFSGQGRKRGAHAVDRPGLAELFGVWEAAGSAPYDVRKRECFAATLQTLRRLPMIFVFEDVDRYDQPSRQLLYRLCQETGEATALLTTSDPAALAIGEADTLVLGPLSAPALSAMGLPQVVLAAGKGVPRDLEQAYRATAEGVHEATLSARIDFLPDDARRMLDALSVAGTQATVGLLAELSQHADPRPPLQELTMRGFLRVSGELVELPSPSFRDVVYQRVREARRRELHRACLGLFEERGAGPTVLAHHALLADPEKVSLHLLERAGDAARNGFDDEGAERWFRHAFQRARALHEKEQVTREVLVQAGLRLALTLRYAGKIVDAEQMLRETLKLGKGDARSEADARRGLARLAYAWDQPAAAQNELFAAIKACWKAGDPILLAELYLELADVLVRAGDTEAAERELREGIDTATCGDGIESEQGPPVLWRLLLRLGELVLKGQRASEALMLGRHALRWAGRAGIPVAKSKAQHFLGLVHQLIGEPQVAARYHHAALEEARLAGDRRSTAELLIVMAHAVQATEQTPQSRGSARALLEEASSLSQQIEWGEGVRMVEQQIADLEPCE